MFHPIIQSFMNCWNQSEVKARLFHSWTHTPCYISCIKSRNFWFIESQSDPPAISTWLHMPGSYLINDLPHSLDIPQTTLYRVWLSILYWWLSLVCYHHLIFCYISNNCDSQEYLPHSQTSQPSKIILHSVNSSPSGHAACLGQGFGPARLICDHDVL